jgi:large subunit ribosomal protein L5
MPDMKKHYNEVVRPELMKRLGLTNVMQIPKLQKIVISTGIGTKMD